MFVQNVPAFAGYKAIKYTGSKTNKRYEGYVWAAQNSVNVVPRDVATKCLTHSDIFTEVANTPFSVSFSPAAAAANVCEVTVTVKDGSGTALANGVANLEVWLSDDAEGEDLTGTTASGTVTAKTASGVVLETVTAKKHLRVQTKKDVGTFILEITDTAKTGFYVCANWNGTTFVSSALVAGNYGA